QNMEIVSIPLAGSLRHQDSMGNKHIIHAREIQVMSAGTGITHSEYNNSDSETVNFLQIWVLPKKMGIKPRYDQKSIDMKQMHNKFILIVAPVGVENVANINQDAYFSMAKIEIGKSVEYRKNHHQHGVYLFVISGQIALGSQELSTRDGIGISDEGDLTLTAYEASEILCIEVPMT
ncbi:MAG: pirin family protein, partial [Candidatus Marinimicrobia bacterium]|nr:pirin family protein [Candidatus Neomarinimicrobiota bacterium]